MDWEGTQPSTQDASQYESYSPQKASNATLISLNPSVVSELASKIILTVANNFTAPEYTYQKG